MTNIMEKTFFKTTEELKEAVSGMDIAFNRVNLSTGSKRAAGYLRDIITPGMYDKALAHYHSDDYQKQENPLVAMDNLVHHVQFVMGNLTMFFHFIWLQLRIGNDTISLTDKENVPYKYQTDEARNQLFETAAEGINDLVDFLVAEVTKETPDEAFNPWKDSSQYGAFKTLLFKNYREFDEYFGIERSAAFFIKARTLIAEAQNDHIEPRVGSIEKILKPVGEGVQPDTKLIAKIKRAAAYLTIAEACTRFDYFWLPASIRGQIDNEHAKKNASHQDFVREKLSALYRNNAEGHLNDVDMYLAQKNKVAADIPYGKFETKPNADDKHVTMI